jgi:hypothetical protein
VIPCGSDLGSIAGGSRPLPLGSRFCQAEPDSIRPRGGTAMDAFEPLKRDDEYEREMCCREEPEF